MGSDDQELGTEEHIRNNLQQELENLELFLR
jgi:hypothetical protein